MEEVELKSTGELIGELITSSIKIYHLVDKALAGDNFAGMQAQRENGNRSALIRAINGRLDPAHQVPEKVHEG